MPEPQAGIIPEPLPHARFLIVRIHDAPHTGAAIAATLAHVPSLTAKVATLDRRAKLVCTVSIGPDLWDTLSPQRRPQRLRPFPAFAVNGRYAPATGGDLFFHIISNRVDLNFELAQRLTQELGGRVEVMEDVAGFRYLDARDLTGFIDGTENPRGKARAHVALIGAEDRAFAGGSYVFTQRYVHDLQKWATLSLKEQELAVGRRKRDSRELPASVKLPTAHLSRVVIAEHGEELQIVRHSFPYGGVTEAGLFFIAYTKDLGIPERMLRRMMGGEPGDGSHDRLLDFSRAVSGATFFAPSLSVLRSLAR